MLAIFQQILLFAIIITQSVAIYLPERGGEAGVGAVINQIDGINQSIEYQQEQQREINSDINYNNNNNNNSVIALIKQKQKQKQQQQLHHKSYDKNDDVVVLSPLNCSEERERDTQKQQQNLQHKQVEEEVKEQTHAEEEHKQQQQQQLQRQRRELSDWLIAPNTRWCGKGNLANGTYNHLGGASAADKCCRKHDHCPYFIPAMSNRFEVFNYRPYTLSHCTCDRRFRTCLKMAHDEDANTIGKLFFNMVQTQCFVLRTERVCVKRAENDICLEEVIKHKGHLKNNKKF